MDSFTGMAIFIGRFIPELSEIEKITGLFFKIALYGVNSVCRLAYYIAFAAAFKDIIAAIRTAPSACKHGILCMQISRRHGFFKNPVFSGNIYLLFRFLHIVYRNQKRIRPDIQYPRVSYIARQWNGMEITAILAIDQNFNEHICHGNVSGIIIHV